MRNRIDNWGNDDIVCPWCGDVQEADDDREYDCNECGRVFTVECRTEIAYFYDTYRDCTLDGSEHDWRVVSRPRDKRRVSYCSQCDQIQTVHEDGEITFEWR